MAKKKFLRNGRQIKTELKKNGGLIALSAITGTGVNLGYQVLKNKIEDEKNKDYMRYGSMLVGLAGIVATEHPIANAASLVLFATSSSDFIVTSFPEEAERMGLTLSGTPQNPDIVIDVPRPAQYQVEEMITQEVDNMLSENSNEPVTIVEAETIAGNDLQTIYQKLN